MAVTCDSHIHSHAGMCQCDTQFHTLPHLFGSTLTTKAFNHFINPLNTSVHVKSINLSNYTALPAHAP